MVKKLLFVILVSILFCTNSIFASEMFDEQAVEYYNDALEAHKLGDLELAISLYTKAIYTKPDYVMAYNNLGTAYAQKSEYVRAEESFNKAIEIDPQYSLALKNLAIIYGEKGDYDKFYEYWKRATGIDVYSPFLIDEEDEG